MESQVLDDGPYRTSKYSSLDTVYSEMLESLRFVKEWEKYRPVIAGGALWSWAAFLPARDVDVFVERTWRSKRKAEKLCSHSAKGPLPDRVCRRSDDGYGVISAEVHKPTYRYLHKLPGTLLELDLVLTPWSEVDVIDHFDYHHCSVAFGPSTYSCHGASYYADGDLKVRFNGGRRSVAVIESKLQRSLWGKPMAVDRLELVIRTLRDLYNTL